MQTRLCLPRCNVFWYWPSSSWPIFLSVTFSIVHRSATAALHACSSRQLDVQLWSRRRRRCLLPSPSRSHSSPGWQWGPLLTSHTPPQEHELSTKNSQNWKHRYVHVFVLDSWEGNVVDNIFFVFLMTLCIHMKMITVSSYLKICAYKCRN